MNEEKQIHKCMASDGKDDSGESISCGKDAEWKMTAVDLEFTPILEGKSSSMKGGYNSRPVSGKVYLVCNEHFQDKSIRYQLLLRHFKLKAVELKENGRTEVIAAPSI